LPADREKVERIISESVEECECGIV
jgi:hypothetical protein